MNFNEPFSECRNLLSDLKGFESFNSKLYEFILKSDSENEGYTYNLQKTYNETDSYKIFLKERLEAEIYYTLHKIRNAFNSIVVPNSRISFINVVFRKIANLIQEFEEYEKSSNTLEKMAFEIIYKLNNELHTQFEEEVFNLSMEQESHDKSAKLKFKISRVELVQLFLLLKDSGIIDIKSDYALSLFLEKRFTYFQESKNEFYDLKKIKKYISEIRRDNQYSESAIKDIKNRILEADIKKVFN